MKKKGMEYENIASRILAKNGYADIKKTIGSGCFWFSKGDRTLTFNDDEYLVEIKGTSKTNYRVSGRTINKIWNEALEEHKFPLFVFLLQKNKKYRLGIIEIGMEYHRNMVAGVSKTQNFVYEDLELLAGSMCHICYENKVFYLNVEYLKE